MGFLSFSSYRPSGWMSWAPILGLRKEPSRFTRPAYKSSFNPASWTRGVGLRAYFLNPISCPSALGYDEHGQGLYHFLNRVRLPHGRSELVQLWLCRRQMSCGNDDFSSFALISSSSFSFFENIL